MVGCNSDSSIIPADPSGQQQPTENDDWADRRDDRRTSLPALKLRSQHNVRDGHPCMEKPAPHRRASSLLMGNQPSYYAGGGGDGKNNVGRINETPGPSRSSIMGPRSAWNKSPRESMYNQSVSASQHRRSSSFKVRINPNIFIIRVHDSW